MGTQLAKLTLNPEHQNLEQIHRIVTAIVERAGCVPCGRLLRSTTPTTEAVFCQQWRQLGFAAMESDRPASFASHVCG
jgi:hypothetical protein